MGDWVMVVKVPVGATFLARPFGSKTVHPPLVAKTWVYNLSWNQSMKSVFFMENLKLEIYIFFIIKH